MPIGSAKYTREMHSLPCFAKLFLTESANFCKHHFRCRQEALGHRRYLRTIGWTAYQYHATGVDGPYVGLCERHWLRAEASGWPVPYYPNCSMKPKVLRPRTVRAPGLLIDSVVIPSAYRHVLRLPQRWVKWTIDAAGMLLYVAK